MMQLVPAADLELPSVEMLKHSNVTFSAAQLIFLYVSYLSPNEMLMASVCVMVTVIAVV